MPNFEALGKELERRGKTGELKRLAESEDGRRLAGLIDTGAVEAAARSGDSQALSQLLRGVLGTAEGQRLAKSVQDLMKK